jgi:hypothetical protein
MLVMIPEVFWGGESRTANRSGRERREEQALVPASGIGLQKSFITNSGPASNIKLAWPRMAAR